MWDSLQSWSAAMDMDCLGKQSGVTRGGNCFLCERATELHGALPSGDKPVDSLWFKIRGQISRVTL